MLELILFSSLNGVLYGMLLFMMAGGLTLIFSMMGVLNFAHASFYMVGAYLMASLAASQARWRDAILLALCLAGGACLLFPLALQLPLRVFP